MFDNFYTWMKNNSANAPVAMDERRRVYRMHPDGSPCYAKNEKDCPLIQHHTQAEKADDLRGAVSGNASESSAGKKRIESGEQFKKRMSALAERVDTEEWSEDLGNEINKAIDDVLDGRSEPSRMPKDVMRRDRMVSIPKWFLGAYHLACGASVVRNYDWDEAKPNRIVEKFLKGIGRWTQDVNGVCEKTYGKAFGEGSESQVFKAGKDKVVKASTLGHTRNVVGAMERLMLSNLLFPGTANKIVAMGSFMGDNRNRQQNHISYILEQNKYRLRYFKSERDAQRAMTRKGFHPTVNNQFCDKANEIRLIDCKLINIPCDSEGQIRFIDPCAVLNGGVAGKLQSLSILGK